MRVASFEPPETRTRPHVGTYLHMRQSNRSPPNGNVVSAWSPMTPPRPLHPAALASKPHGVVLVRVRPHHLDLETSPPSAPPEELPGPVSFSLEEVLRRVRRTSKSSEGELSGSNYKTMQAWFYELELIQSHMAQKPMLRCGSTNPTPSLKTLQPCSTASLLASLLAAYQHRSSPCSQLGEAWPYRNRQESGYSKT